MPALQTNGEFFSKYRELNANYDSRVFAAAQKTISKLLESETTSERPGMLLGKVQSSRACGISRLEAGRTWPDSTTA